MFTAKDKHKAVGPAFAAILAGLLSCVAKQICVNIEFNEGYRVTHAHSNYDHEPEPELEPDSFFMTGPVRPATGRFIFEAKLAKIRQDQADRP